MSLQKIGMITLENSGRSLTCYYPKNRTDLQAVLQSASTAGVQVAFPASGIHSHRLLQMITETVILPIK